MKQEIYNASLKLHILDVGHGDSIIIEFPDNKSFAIIDCCRRTKRNGHYNTTNNRSLKSLAYFKDIHTRGIPFEIEFVCLTHPHDDHYRGFGELLKWFINNNIRVKQFWDFGSSFRKANALLNHSKHSTSPDIKMRAFELNNLYLYRNELEIKQQTEYRMITCPSKLFWSNDSITIDVIAPNDSHSEKYSNFLACRTESEKRRYMEVNDCKWVADDNIISSAFILKFGSIKILLGGDVINESWYKILLSKRRSEIECNVIKVSHHGSIHGNFPFLEKEPENSTIPIWAYMNTSENKTVAVISGGYRKSLPHDSTLDSLSKMQIPWFCTGSAITNKFSYYIPEAIDESYKFHFEQIKTCEVIERYKRGHGDITVHCFENGSYFVNTEHHMQPCDLSFIDNG